jgi:hypothetical protein
MFSLDGSVNLQLSSLHLGRERGSEGKAQWIPPNRAGLQGFNSAPSERCVPWKLQVPNRGNPLSTARFFQSMGATLPDAFHSPWLL